MGREDGEGERRAGRGVGGARVRSEDRRRTRGAASPSRPLDAREMLCKYRALLVVGCVVAAARWSRGRVEKGAVCQHSHRRCCCPTLTRSSHVIVTCGGGGGARRWSSPRVARRPIVTDRRAEREDASGDMSHVVREQGCGRGGTRWGRGMLLAYRALEREGEGASNHGMRQDVWVRQNVRRGGRSR